MPRISDRIRRIERELSCEKPSDRVPTLSELNWDEVIALLPLERMYPEHPHLWREPRPNIGRNP